MALFSAIILTWRAATGDIYSPLWVSRLLERESHMSPTILDETVDVICEHYGERLRGITVDRLAIGIFFTAVKLSCGSGGISYTPALEIHLDPTRPPLDKEPQPRFKGMPVIEVLASRNDSILFRTIRLVVMNALAAPLHMQGKYRVIEGPDVLDLLNLDRVKRIAMVGAILPFVNRLKDMPGLDLKVIEKKNETLSEDVRSFCVPIEQTRQALAECDLAVITGAAIANGTIDSLLDWKPPNALAIVVGPTASFVPDALFSRGVAVVSGVIVSDPDQAVDMVSEGALAYHLFHECVRKVSIVNSSLADNEILVVKASR
jgi:uncharacterized protein